jgi:hypothetical protein
MFRRTRRPRPIRKLRRLLPSQMSREELTRLLRADAEAILGRPLR